jgi:hypothetical protein
MCYDLLLEIVVKKLWKLCNIVFHNSENEWTELFGLAEPGRFDWPELFSYLWQSPFWGNQRRAKRRGGGTVAMGKSKKTSKLSFAGKEGGKSFFTFTARERGPLPHSNAVFRRRFFFFMRKMKKSREKHEQGCQMVYFQTKSPNLGKFESALDYKMLIYFMCICNILWTFGIFYDHLVHFVFIW